MSLARFDFSDSLRHNPIVLYIALSVVLINVLAAVAVAKKKESIFFAWRPIVYCGIVIMMLFCIVKNVLLIFFKVDLSGELINYWT